jgi:general secretion pathway protein D
MTQVLVMHLALVAKHSKHMLLTTVMTALLTGITACTTPFKPLPGPLEFPRSPKPDAGLNNPAVDGRPTATQVAAMPGQPLPQGSPIAAAAAAPTVSTASGGPGDEVSMAIEQTPLPVFLQILYGNVLKKAYSLDPAVQSRTDLVTFKTSVPIGRERMQAVAVNLLRSYGLSVQDFDGLVRIVPEANAPVSPVLRRGRTLPETPEASRPVFQHVELEVVRSAEAIQWMRQILGTRVNITEDTNRNGLLLAGTPADLRAALDMVQALDQPRMRGRVARRISPAFAGVADFSNRLVEMLGAQGYAASSTLSTSVPILILPIPSISSVVAFTNNEATMEHVLRWARELDKPAGGATSNGLFTYAVKYADAQDLAKTLGDLLGSSGAPAAAPAAAGPLGGGGGGGAAPAAGGRASGGRVVVNNATNTLIFRGSSADEYQQIQSLLRELDRPSKSALIEVVVAELNRGEAQALGVQWTYNKYGVGGATEKGSSSGDGFNFSVTNNAVTILSQINALASNNKARILSNPKVMARNGESASIQVGSEVPIITSQQSNGSSSTGLFSSTPNLTQTVQYRSTGVILRVRPVINSGNRMDLEIQQEVSSAKATNTGVSASPTIATRRVDTKLSVRDGSTVVLAGLIDRTTSDANSGVPFLKDIPFLGALFRSESVTTAETELLVMITAHVINDDYEAEGVSDALQATFGDWAQDIKKARIGEPLKREAEANALPPARAPAAPRATGTEPGTDIGPALPAELPVERIEPPATRPTNPAAVAPANIMEGISTTPQLKPAPATGKAAEPGKKPSTAGSKAPAAAGPAGAASAAPPPADAPIKGGKTVEDDKVKQDIQKLFDSKR